MFSYIITMAGSRPSKQGGKATNKAKRARRTFAPKTAKYKSDYQDAVCTVFVDRDDAITDLTSSTQGQLANPAAVPSDGDIAIHAVIPLDVRAPLWASHRHASLINMYNNWNTSGVYIDLLFSKELRENCDQIFLLAERGNTAAITSEKQMVSDVNCRMYQLGNNTQKLTYKYVFTTAVDKLDKRSEDAFGTENDKVFLKLLCKGKNGKATTINVGTGAATETSSIPAGACQIKMRARWFNKYRDMKVLTSDLN